MITPGGIPQITGDLDACYSHGFMVSVLGSRFADTGSAVMQAWSGLAGVYQAPESGILLQAMVPVAFTAAGVGTDLNATGSAIMGYATAVRPIQARLHALVAEATTFVDYANANSNWNTDQGRVDHHNAMLAEVNDLMAQWEAAQRACANTIDGLYGGTQYAVNNGDSTASANEYGLTKDQWGSVGAGDQGVPWGTTVERDKPWYEDAADAVGGFFVGAWHGLTGMVTGLGGLVGFQGWSVMGQSWKGLGALVIVASRPELMFTGEGVPGYKPGELQATVTGMGKSLIAWNQWSSDPAQAAGESVFNIATFFIPVGGAAAGTAKAVSLAGKAAEVAGVAGKIAKVGDVLKASRVADVVAGVRAALDSHLNNAANTLHMALGRPDLALAGPGHLRLPEAPVPHTPNLHATTVHPDAPPAPHPSGPSAPADRAPELQTAPSRSGSEAPVVDRTVHVDPANVPGPRTPFAGSSDLLPNTRYDVPGRGSYFTDGAGQINHVEATSGASGGRLNPDLQRPLPNATYVVDHNYTFHTDDAGRTVEIHTDSLPTDAARRSPSVQQSVGSSAGPGFEGGHGAGAHFNGPPERINIFPQLEAVNRGAQHSFLTMENTWRQLQAANPGIHIEVDVSVTYADTAGKIPVRFDVEYKAGSGKWVDEVFRNVP